MNDLMKRVLDGEIVVVDSINNKFSQELLENTFLKVPEVNYQYHPTTVYNEASDSPFYGKNDKTIESHQMVHTVNETNGNLTAPTWHLISPILMNVCELFDSRMMSLRTKVNLNFPDKRFDKTNHFTPHLDADNPNLIIGLYYINDCDGDTFFFDKEGKITKKITPRKGTMAFWRNTHMHCGQPPFESNVRGVINFLFIYNL